VTPSGNQGSSEPPPARDNPAPPPYALGLMSVETDNPPEPRARRRWRWPFGPVRTMLIVSLALSLFFLVFPRLDIWFSGLFYDPEYGFAASHVPVFNWLRWFAATLIWVIVVALILSMIAKLALPRRPSFIPTRTSVFLLSTLIIGPGLIVNVILKSLWGRPRPISITDFGGDLPYVDVWRISDYCTHNCSFVSGEASSAIWLLALALVVPAAWRNRVAIIALVLAIVFSLNRVAFGAHFLSDTLIAWSLTLLVVAIAHHFLFVRPPRGLAANALEAGMTNAGSALRRIGRQRGDTPAETTPEAAEVPDASETDDKP
jgi:lipid A 4'-phosphatase